MFSNAQNSMRRRNVFARVVIAGIGSLAVYLALVPRASSRLPGYSPSMLQAGATMQRALELVRARRAALGIAFDQDLDPNLTGLVGPELSDLMTTAGDLEAKRTTTNPNMAGLIVHLLAQAGVSHGQAIGIACSGSFPALMIASIAAAKSLGVRPIVILSLGASSYGATSTRFNLLDIYGVLLRGGICDEPAAAVSLGGEKDTGLDFDAATRDSLVRQILRSGVPFIHESDLRANVSQRISLYENAAKSGLAAVINCGGSYTSLGTSTKALELNPGLVANAPLPAQAERGLVHDMVARGIPVIHLLHIKGLVLHHGLPWDPVPLPEPAAFSVPGSSPDDALFWIVSLLYLALLVLLAAWPGRPSGAGVADFR